MRIKVNERRFAWFANTLDVLFSKFDVIFLSAAASNYFLGLYSIPGILVGVCYSMFSTISSAGFNSSKVGGASTKLRIAIQLNLMLTFTTFAISGLFLSIALEPIFGAAYSESLSLLTTSLGFCLCLSIAVPYIQYSLIRRSSLWPTVGVTVVVTAAALVALKTTGSILLSANLLGWFLAIALFILVAKSQPPPYSFGSKSQFKDFLRAG
jgi:O-antigen/teichoic acid export membrane protein